MDINVPGGNKKEESARGSNKKEKSAWDVIRSISSLIEPGTPLIVLKQSVMS